MKKPLLEESIKNASYLIMVGVPVPVVLFALKSDGLNSKQAQTVIRWAQLKVKEKSSQTVIDVEYEDV